MDRKSFFRTIGGSVDIQENKEYSKKLPSLSIQKTKVLMLILK